MGANDSISAIWANQAAGSEVCSGLALGGTDGFGDELVARLAQAVLGAEVVDHQAGADARGLGDGPQADVEAVLAELFDRRVANPGGRGQIVH